MNCITCNQEIITEWRKDKKYVNKIPLKFCSRKCSNTKNHSAQTKHKISSKMKEKFKQGTISLPPKSSLKTQNPKSPNLKLTKTKRCKFCSKDFIANRRHTKKASWPTICSNECYIATKRQNARGSKQINYKGMSFDSKWELEYAKFLEEHSIPFIIPQPINWIDSNQKTHKYFPDFYIKEIDLYIDPKNPIVIIQQKEKLDIVSKQINLIYGDLNFVKEQTLLKWRARRELNPHVSN
jgi:hypothetical protein